MYAMDYVAGQIASIFDTGLASNPGLGDASAGGEIPSKPSPCDHIS